MKEISSVVTVGLPAWPIVGQIFENLLICVPSEEKAPATLWIVFPKFWAKINIGIILAKNMISNIKLRLSEQKVT